MIPTRTAPTAPTNRVSLAFIGAAAATAVAGAVVALILQPTTTISTDMWRYPWSSSGAFVAFSILSAIIHGLVAAGLVGFGRSGAAGRSRAAVAGVALTVGGTAGLTVGELLSISIRDAAVDDTSATIVGAFFGLASLASTIGFLLAGWATLRAGVWHGWRRYPPLATGVWLVALTPISLIAPTLLHGGVGIYGLCILALAIALHTTSPTVAAAAGELQLRRA